KRSIVCIITSNASNLKKMRQTEIVNQKAQELIQKGDKLVEDGKYDEALDFYEKALIVIPIDPNLWNKKEIALRSLGRYDEAVVCFNKSLEISPRDLDAS